MVSYFCLTARFLQPLFHGRADGGEPEWPPSPLRAFQALVSAAARKPTGGDLQSVGIALYWLEKQAAPLIVAPVGRTSSSKYRQYVPDNVADKVGKAWSGGREADMANYRTEKDVCPTHLCGGDAVHYLFPLSNAPCPNFDLLLSAARSITHLGWGVDMVAGNAAIISEEDVSKMQGERWQSVDDASANGYRVPVEGTLDALVQKHEAFLNRVTQDGFHPVPPLSAFRIVRYRRTTDPIQRLLAAFSILKPDASAMRPFDATRRTRDVAGMVRHAVANAALEHGWSPEQINVFIHGKTPDGKRPVTGAISPDRFMYLPLPTINQKLGRAESIRRVLVAAPLRCEEQIAWVRRALAGEELSNDGGNPMALLTILPRTDWVLRKYVDKSRSWSTVTPVILPGHDDHDPGKADRLLRTAFGQAGYAKELIDLSELEWRRGGFRPGVDLATRYLPPENLAHRPQYHVRVRFPHPIPGPLVVGSGRFRGFGLFAATDEV